MVQFDCRRWCWLVVAVLARVATAQTPTRVLDINPTPAPGPSSSPLEFTPFAGTVYFSAQTPGAGRELWRSDGTDAGTALVGDLQPGPGSSSPFGLTVAGSTLFFVADDGVHGRELWATASASSPALVLDVNAGAGSGLAPAAPRQLGVLGTTVYFPADDGVHGFELWKSDGSSGGTALVKDLNPGAGASAPHGFFAQGATLYFSADDGVHGVELWKTDGTASGTVLVLDINPSGASEPAELTTFAGAVFFSAFEGGGRELWRSDGTPAGTQRVKTTRISSSDAQVKDLAAIGSVLYFRATDGLSGVEPWRSDGTSAGTVMLRDLAPGTFSSMPFAPGFTPAGSTVVFAAYDPTAGDELMCTNGVDTGTFVLQDIYPGGEGSYPSLFTPLGNNAVFAATQPTTGLEPWFTDGTDAGTHLIKDLSPGAGGSLLTTGCDTTFTALDAGRLLFAANSGQTGCEPFVTDGTSAGTHLYVDVAYAPPSTLPSNANCAVATPDGGLLFAADDGTSGLELWVTDGTAAGSHRVKDINVGPTGSAPSGFTTMGAFTYFSADDGVTGRELWRTDGTAAGTTLVADVEPGSGPSWPDQLVVRGATLFFAAFTTASGYEVWKSDGTATGTAMVRDLYTAPGAGSNPAGLMVQGGTLFFSASQPTSTGRELWSSDGTAAGTQQVADIATGPNDGVSDQGPWVLNGGVYFACGGTYKTLCALGGAAPPFTYSILAPAAAGTDVTEFTVVGSTAYFCATDPLSGVVLRSTDGTGVGTRMVQDATLGLVGNCMILGSTGSDLIYVGRPAQYGGDTVVFGVRPGGSPTQLSRLPASGPLPASFTLGGAAGGRLLFGACDFNDGGAGCQTWRTDGTAAGTDRYLGGIALSSPSSTCRLAALGGNLYGGAADPTGDVELWRFDPTPPAVTSSATGTVGDGGWFVSDVAVSFTVSEPESGASLVTTAPCGGASVTQDTAGTMVTCAATSLGGVTTRSVLVRRDVTPPVLTCPVVVDGGEATSFAGAVVPFPDPTATDEASTPVVERSRDSGTVFPLGRTTVAASARDDIGHVSTCAFDVVVVDTQAPVVSCPPNQNITASSPDGGDVPYPAPTATDIADPHPTVTVSHDAGFFPTGTTRVDVVAVDASGNDGGCSFDVVVTYTSPLSITCPILEPRTATSSRGIAVSFPDAIARSTAPGPVGITYSPPSGSTFPVGDTEVTATATDSAGRVETCTFTISVAPPSAQQSRYAMSCGCTAGESGSVAWAWSWLLSLVALSRGARRRPTPR